MYNRAVRVKTYIYEALMRLAWAEFIMWVEENHQEKKSAISSVLDQVNSMTEELCQQNFDNVLHSSALVELRNIWNDFVEHLHHAKGDLSTFWMSYVDMVEDVLLSLLRASCEGNWELHLNSIRSMIPWCFAYGKLNYAIYLPAYYAQMTNLPEEHPDVYESFMTGIFSVQISGNNPFGRSPADQTTEVTVNKDTQTPSGAIKRYYITVEHWSA